LPRFGKFVYVVTDDFYAKYHSFSGGLRECFYNPCGISKKTFMFMPLEHILEHVRFPDIQYFRDSRESSVERGDNEFG